MTDNKEYIERNSLKKDFGGCDLTTLSGPDKYETMMMYEILDEIDREPAVDVIEVVQCEECRFYKFGLCAKYMFLQMKPNDFCSRGERRIHGKE